MKATSIEERLNRVVWRLHALDLALQGEEHNDLETSHEEYAGMRQVIADLDATRSGRFWAWNGEEIPW